MAKKIIFVDQVAQYPNRFLVTDDGGGLKEVTPSPGTISIQGTPLSADNLNAIANEVIYKLKDTSNVANTYTAIIDGLIAYFDSLTILFKPSNTNTDASTLNVTNLGAIPIKKVDDAGALVALSQNDLIKNKYYTMTYDTTDPQNPYFIMNNPSAELAGIVTAVNSLEDRLSTDEEAINSIKTETVKFTILQGNINTYASTISTVSSLTSGLEINLIPNVTNTGASTLNINELGAKAITYNGSPISSGMLAQNKPYKVLYNGVSFELQPSSNFVPVSNGQIQTNLNADTVDGKHASDFASSTQGNKADNALPASSYTASDVLSKIKSVDGSGSGLDADLLDGHDSSYFAKATDIPIIPSSLPANGGNSATVNGFTASGTPSTTEKTNIVGMVNEVFQSASNLLSQVNSGKNNIYNAVVGKNVTPTSNNFIDLVTAISNIATGKRIATGSTMPHLTTYDPYYADGSRGFSCFITPITIPFSPSWIIAIAGSDIALFNKMPDPFNWDNTWKLATFNNNYYQGYTRNIRTIGMVTSTTVPTNYANSQLNWWAIE